ncbi:site-specific integrase [Variovorax robiniae]|uniref:Site-specific integrase n=1 Tax=Variovorax robiniae TaxID=1836199 RepID=A0ABU8XFK5_9BURK
MAISEGPCDSKPTVEGALPAGSPQPESLAPAGSAPSALDRPPPTDLAIAAQGVDAHSLAVLRPLEVPLLDPQAVSGLTEASVGQFLVQGQSPNTLASYATATRYWSAWFAARYGQPLTLPVSVPVVLQFIVDHAERLADCDDGQVTTGRPVRLVHDLPEEIDRLLVATHFKGKPGPLALSTLLHRVSVLSTAHQLRELDNPCSYPAVRQLIRMVRTGYARRQVRPRQQMALTRDHLEAILQTCDASPRGVRDRALLCFAWSSGGRRRSEVAAATVENLQDHGARGYIYLLGHSKNNQEGTFDDSTQKPLAGQAAKALSAWLKLADVREGPIFRRVLKSGRILAEPLTPRAVRTIVMNRSQLAGLAGHYSAHSLRSGFVTEAGRQQVPAGEAMKMTGHRNWEVFMGYYRAGDLLGSSTANMLDGPPR